jgi:glycosyltransferase involved in cell wall biosynthesis
MSKNPLISIITVVYNGASILEETILSVINQTYDNVEYIIIDGKSTDGTIDIIKKYEDKIALWSSERDSGIYDAMNKGIDKATGEWINFMNAGDSFASPNVLESIFYNHSYDVDVIYGDVLYLNNNKGEILIQPADLSNLWKGMRFVHQSSFVRTSLMKEYHYDTNYKIAADYNFLFQLYHQHYRFLYIPISISRFAAGGLSDNNPKGIKECIKITTPIYNKLKHKLFYRKRLITCWLKYNFAKIIGQSKYASIRKTKRLIKKKMGLIK